MKNHKDLDVWQRSMDLVVTVYEVTRSWPKEELFGITSQVRRAAVSVPSNLAEGAGRSSKADFNRFLTISQGSLAEVETQLEIARRIGFSGDFQQMQQHIDSIRRMLIGLQKCLVGHDN
ncbi:MAG: four helix bundle protein [Desulfuromonadales bacterium]|nr:four helix bundle protein [Desulfuromonadales bacterium]